MVVATHAGRFRFVEVANARYAPEVLVVTAGGLMIFLEDPGRPTGLGSTNRNIFEMNQNAINNSRKITQNNASVFSEESRRN